MSCKENERKVLVAFSLIFQKFVEQSNLNNDKEKNQILFNEDHFYGNLAANFFGFKLKPYISCNESLGSLLKIISYNFFLLLY